MDSKKRGRPRLDATKTRHMISLDPKLSEIILNKKLNLSALCELLLNKYFGELS